MWSSCDTLPCTTCSGECSTGVVQLLPPSSGEYSTGVVQLCITLPCTTCSGECSTDVVQLCHFALYHLFWRVLYRCASSCAYLAYATTCSGELLYRCGPVVPPCLVPSVLESALQMWSSCCHLALYYHSSGECSKDVVQLCYLFWRVLYKCGPVAAHLALYHLVLESALQMWSSCASLCLVPSVLESALQMWSSCATLPCTTCSGECSKDVVQLCYLFWRVLYKCGPVAARGQCHGQLWILPHHTLSSGSH